MAKKFDIEYWSGERGLETLEAWGLAGYTKMQVAKKIGCSLSTIKRYIHKDYALRRAFERGAEIADRKVENSLYEKCFERRIGDEIIDSSLPAIKFWLQNRKPNEWSLDHQKHEYAKKAIADGGITEVKISLEKGVEFDEVGEDGEDVGNKS